MSDFAQLTDGPMGAELQRRKCAVGRLVEAYRDARREAGGRPPARVALGPERLRGILGWEFLAVWRAPASIVVRLSGVHIDYVLGTNVTGIDFFDLYPPEARDGFARFYAAIAGGPCGGYTRRDVVVGGHETYDYHSVYLPLAPEGDVVPMIGAVSIAGFERRAEIAGADHRPDFRWMTRMAVFDLGDGVPDHRLDRLDIEAVLDGIEADSGPMLDQRALEARSLVGRPQGSN